MFPRHVIVADCTDPGCTVLRLGKNLRQSFKTVHNACSCRRSSSFGTLRAIVFMKVKSAFSWQHLSQLSGSAGQSEPFAVHICTWKVKSNMNVISVVDDTKKQRRSFIGRNGPSPPSGINFFLEGRCSLSLSNSLTHPSKQQKLVKFSRRKAFLSRRTRADVDVGF